MGIRRYLERKNWYSDEVILLLKRDKSEKNHYVLREGHSVKLVDKDNVADSQSFEKELYTKIYNVFLEHEDIGIFGYINGTCVARCWGVINPTDVKECGVNLGLPKDSIFLHYVETDKDYRNQGIGKECIMELIRRCGNKDIYVTINIDNDASLHMHKRYGKFKECGLIKIKRRWMKTKGLLYRFE